MLGLSYIELAKRFRPKMREYIYSELTDKDREDLLGYTRLQPKYDGHFVVMVLEDASLAIISSNGNLICKYYAEMDEQQKALRIIFLAEYLFGTQWALNNYLPKHGVPEVDNYVIHTVYLCTDEEISELQWAEQDRLISHSCKWFNTIFDHIHAVPCPSYPVKQFEKIWDLYVTQQDYEGLVFKGFGGLCAKLKDTDTVDLFITGFKESVRPGLLGSVYVAQYDTNGNIIDLGTVGIGFDNPTRLDIWNNPDMYINRVIEVTVRERFKSGKLRHASFERFRDDKLAEQCIYRKESE